MTEEEKKEIKKKQKAYLKTKTWERVKEAVLERDGYRCRVTGKSKDDGAVMVVHHTVYNHYGEGTQSEIDDCITIEKNTHMAIHRCASNRRWFAIDNPRNVKND